MALRVAVIGCGHIGNLHADIYKNYPLVELVGVCDLLKDRADGAARRLGVPAFYDAPSMLQALAPDLCSVATGGYESGSDHYQPRSRRWKRAATSYVKSPSATPFRRPRRWSPAPAA